LRRKAPQCYFLVLSVSFFGGKGVVSLTGVRDLHEIIAPQNIAAGVARRNILGWSLDPHSARNGREKRIKKQVQGGDSSVGKREKRNLKYEDEEETN
jgi:hypothetical protein